MTRAIFGYAEFKELLKDDKTTTNGITFILNGESNDDDIKMTSDDLLNLSTGEVVTSFSINGLKVEYILQDIGFQLIIALLKRYKR